MQNLLSMLGAGSAADGRLAQSEGLLPGTTSSKLGIMPGAEAGFLEALSAVTEPKAEGGLRSATSALISKLGTDPSKAGEPAGPAIDNANSETPDTPSAILRRAFDEANPTRTIEVGTLGAAEPGAPRTSDARPVVTAVISAEDMPQNNPSSTATPTAGSEGTTRTPSSAVEATMTVQSTSRTAPTTTAMAGSLPTEQPGTMRPAPVTAGAVPIEKTDATASSETVSRPSAPNVSADRPQSAPTPAAQAAHPDRPAVQAAPAQPVSGQSSESAPAASPRTPAGDTLPILASSTPQPGAAAPFEGARHVPIMTPAATDPAAQIAEAIRIRPGEQQITVRLDPAELGTVKIEFTFDRAAAVTAIVSADQPSTEAMLRRHADWLQQALSEAGFEGADIGWAQSEEAFEGQWRTLTVGEDRARNEPLPLAAGPALPYSSDSGRIDIRL